MSEDGSASEGEEEKKEEDEKLELSWPEKRVCLSARK
jgi:hypothetical protein